jgi:Beta-propeller repeat/FG-GAP-like repeat
MRSRATKDVTLWIMIRRTIYHSTIILSLAAFLILAMSRSTEARGLDWAKQAGGTDSEEGFGIALDGSGNSSVTGYFEGTATFGAGEANQTTLTAAGSSDIFVAKYNSSGVLLWAKQAGGTDLDEGSAIAVDGSGNIYVTGYFEGTATFGAGEANQTTLTAVDRGDVFVAKYNSSGALQWAKRAGGTEFEEGFGIAVDGSGNSYITGYFEGAATFGLGEGNQTMLTSDGSDDVFVAKYNSIGTLQWARRAGGTGFDDGFGIAVDGSGNGYVTGYFQGTATFGLGEANQTVLSASGSNDAFVAKYNSSGALQWAKRAGGTGFVEGFGIKIDDSGNGYVAGSFAGSVTFGLGEASQAILTAAGSDDIFLAKYNSNGALLWATRSGGAGFDEGFGIAVDGSGNSFVTGYFDGSATFGAGDANQTTVISNGGFDIFVAKYDSNGALLWAKGAGGTGFDISYGVAVDGSGNSYATGSIEGSAIFDAGEASQAILAPAGGFDIYVAKFRNLESILVGSLSVTGGQNILIGGAETGGFRRGPAFQRFNTSGVLQATQFALNPDFSDIRFVLGNFDGDVPDEILVGGRETSGISRGPGYQIFDSNGSLLLTRFALNPNFTGISFSPLNLANNGTLVCGWETGGLGRGPAYQAFDSSGSLVRTQFALNTDFSVDNNCIGINLDGVAGDEIIIGGREITGAARGPGLQVFNSNGSLRFTQFVLNSNFTETTFTVADIAPSGNGIIAYGRETKGPNRGPAFQTFDANGSMMLTRFVLNPDFTNIQIFGANSSNAVAGNEIIVSGTETGGLARGPAIQVWDKNGNHLLTRFVLNSDFTEVKFSKIDINNDGVDEILVMGRETGGIARGPAIQLFDGNGNHLFTQFVLNSDFRDIKVFAVDLNGDGDNEIGVGGIETSGLARGPAYQIFEANGAVLQTKFVLNGDF